MFERFTDEARQVVVEAQRSARELGHGYIASEHLLLGLVDERFQDAGLIAVLHTLGLTRASVHAQVIATTGRGSGASSGQIPFRPQAKKVLELSLREALGLGHDWIGSEHITLGLVHEDNDGVAMQIIRDAGNDAASVRDAIIARLSSGAGARAKAIAAEARTAADARRAARVTRGPGENFTVEPGPQMRRLLQRAAARALGDGRAQYELEDVLAAAGQDKAADADQDTET